jgi:hypothetical protein
MRLRAERGHDVEEAIEMRMHHLLMIGTVLVLIVLTSTGVVGGPLGTLLLVGLLLLCPLMMLGVHGDGRPHGDGHTSGASDLPGSPRDGVGGNGR